MSYSPILGQVSEWFKLLHTPAIGFDAAEVDHDGWLSVVGGVRPLVVLESDTTTDACLSLRVGFSGVQLDAFILHRPQQALEKDVVEAAPLAVD